MPDGIVQQTAHPANADGTTPSYRLNRRGEIVVPDFFTQLALDGHIFCSSDADGDDAVASIAAFSATTPQLLLSVPSGTTALPLWLDVNNQGADNGATGTITIMYDRIDRYSTSGTSETVSAYRTDRAVSATCLVRSTATAAAATEARTIFTAQYETSDGTAVINAASVHWSARTHFSPALVGPASLIVWFDSNSGTPGFAWSMGWAEFVTGSAT